MSIFARPYDYTQDQAKNIRILDGLCADPKFLAYPTTPEEARYVWIGVLTNPANIVFEAWRDQELLGIMYLSRIAPRVDALLHFLFLDKDLVGKRTLLKNFITFCFKDLGFHRLSMEVPEGVRLERFARKVLRFRLEGELRARNPELPKALDNTWVARQGSRWDSMYFDGETWSDILRLRLLASEWVGTGEGEPHAATVDSVGRRGGHSSDQ